MMDVEQRVEASAQTFHWWQRGIIYQIYPRSFQDSNGDGVGDLPGIQRRLNYLQRLGIDILWLSPIYPSPMHDFGYDIADYTDIHPMFGTMADFEALLADVHSRGMKLVLDLVPNHTSDEHPWFIESSSRKDNAKRNWYIWSDPGVDGGPPNNWLSIFGGSAWTFDEATGQYYLHQFARQQPELNYRHPDVLPAMLDVMRFWLGKGVDGFRVDVIALLLKDEQLRDNPTNPDWDGINPARRLKPIYTQNLPAVHGIIKQMRAVLDEYDDRLMVGEIYLPNEEIVAYYGNKRADGSFDECHLPFNFQLIGLEWSAQTVRRAVDAYEACLPTDAWPNWVLGNHDRHRIASRIGKAQARVANMLLLTLRGTPTTYYGEEIGMQNGAIPPEFVRDPPALFQPEVAHLIGRDPERTPMQWDASPNCGFAPPGVRSWLPVADNHEECNVKQQSKNANSMLNLYKALADLRRREPALYGGHYLSVDTNAPDIFAYSRFLSAAESFLIVLNLGNEDHTLDLSHVGAQADIAVATDIFRSGRVDLSALDIGADEALVLRLVDERRRPS